MLMVTNLNSRSLALKISEGSVKWSRRMPDFVPLLLSFAKCKQTDSFSSEFILFICFNLYLALPARGLRVGHNIDFNNI